MPAGTPYAPPTSLLPAVRADAAEGFSTELKVAMGVAGGMVALLLVVIVVQVSLSGRGPSPAGTEVASTPSVDGTANPLTAAPPVEAPAAPGDIAPTIPSRPRYGPPPGASGRSAFVPHAALPDGTTSGLPSAATARPTADPDQGQIVSAAGSLEPATKAVAGSVSLPLAVGRWHASSAPLRGTRRAGDKDFIVFHYSWMCELLPFLGHEPLYQQFSFQKPWSDEKNAELCTTVIPAFLNPADDRQRWTGHQLRGLALTHFVGMSGVEDSRNVVAATLPRSDPRAGIFGYDEVARREQIADGISHTIMLIGSGEVVAPWVQGGGATVRGARPPYFDSLTGFGSRGLATEGAIVLMADGATRHVNADIDPAVFRALCTIRGGESVDVSQAGAAATGWGDGR